MALKIEEINIGSVNFGTVGMSFGGVISKITQTFTANRTYTLQAIVLRVAANPPPLGTTGGIYSVSGGVPNVKLEDFTIIATNPPEGRKEEIAVLDSPLELTGETQYAIVVNEPASSSFEINYLRAGQSTYEGGIGLRFAIGAWQNLDPGFESDFYFITYSSFSLTPTPSDEATGTVLFPTLSWVVD